MQRSSHAGIFTQGHTETMAGPARTGKTRANYNDPPSTLNSTSWLSQPHVRCHGWCRQRSLKSPASSQGYYGFLMTSLSETDETGESTDFPEGAARHVRAAHPPRLAGCAPMARPRIFTCCITSGHPFYSFDLPFPALATVPCA
jgi:hypothetical protein